MRKRIIARQDVGPAESQWLNLERIAAVEVTSEDPAYPVETALLPRRGPGWRAAERGEQTLRLRFDEPQRLRLIQLQFVEADVQRTQEYVLRWSGDNGHSFRDIVRQQWSFSPLGATAETENHHVELAGVSVLELSIIPDVTGGSAVASLLHMRLA